MNYLREFLYKFCVEEEEDDDLKVSLTFNFPHNYPRYNNCWMPLAAEVADHQLADHSSTALLPPLDVQWVWHCHCLSPVRNGAQFFSIPELHPMPRSESTVCKYYIAV